MELCPDSDGETGYEVHNSSQSSGSSSGSVERCSSFSRFSFDTVAGVDSHLTVSSKPHRSSDPAWEAIRAQHEGHGLPSGLGPRDFKLVRRIGSGDIGTVYLCRLRDAASPCAYAMKVVDKLAVGKKGKLGRAETERRILRSLDHPFLPTLYAEFDATPHYSCVVMEYCSGGDLHSLRHRQPGHCFPASSARFYAAEVLLALEYLHLLGVVYRDLKPENVLVRSDGHIMLSDFDLSLESTASPMLEQLSSSGAGDGDDSPLGSTTCIPARLFRSRRGAGRQRRFVAEPVAARSCSFVGTHEYVAPEVASGGPHGSAVDWWAYGVFLYELLHGKTPFAGPTNEATLRNIVGRPMAFAAPAGGPLEEAARDLVAGLLAKDPAARLGSRSGAADVKGHRFFKGINFALLRTYPPPVLGRSSTCRERHLPRRFDYF